MALPAEWAWVETLIAKEGRTFTVTVPGAEADANKPWRGNAAGTPTGVIGVFFHYKAVEIDDDHVKRGDQRVCVIPHETIDIENATKVVDSLDNSGWNVIDVQKISHKSDIILYILQIRQ
jgi:hypothetical protein